MSTTDTTDKYLQKVMGLLAKAESTEFPEEAEALFSKAQSLMARHAIDEAMLVTASTAHEDPIGGHRFFCPAPYASAKMYLLNEIALANSCRLIDLGKGVGQCFGHASDIETVKTLFIALSMHSARSLAAADMPYYESPRAFRHAFLVGYAGRIGKRLRDAVAQASRDYEAETGASVAVVLVERKSEVAKVFKEAYPSTRSDRTSVSSRAGMSGGEAAANRADLGGARLGGKGRMALNR